MATAQLTASSISARNLPSFKGFRPSTARVLSVAPLRQGGLGLGPFRGLVVKASATIAPKVHCFLSVHLSSCCFSLIMLE